MASQSRPTSAKQKRLSQQVMKAHDKDLFAWSWNAPPPAGSDPQTYVKETNHAEVREWLANEGLQDYAPLFQKHNVSGAEVPYLTDDHLKQMGIAKVGHRLRITKSAKNFKRTLHNWQRNETVMECHNWHLRPRSCVFFPTKYRLTPAAIVVFNPQPTQCGYEMDIIDVTTIVDINMEEFMGFLGYVEVRSTDKRLPRIVIRLRLHQAREAFKILKNLWEEDQIRVGAIARIQN